MLPNILSSLPARSCFHRLPVPRLAWGLAIGLSLAAGAARAANNNDALLWNGSGDTSWTSGNPVWYDTTLSSAVSLGDASGNQGQTYSYTFNGAGANATVAPTAMTIGDDNSTTNPAIGYILGENALTYNNGFNATNTMAISSGHDAADPIAESLNFATGWSITNNATGGSVTFNTTDFNSVLYFTLAGAGTIATPNANASVVVNSAITDSGSAGSITKTGSGTLALGAASQLGNTYGGGTAVNGGTLLIAGNASGTSATGTGALTVNMGATLAGSGYALGNTTIAAGGTLSPGTGPNGIGILALGSNGTTSGVAINGTFRVDLVGGGTTAGVNNDQVKATTGTLGTVSLGTLNAGGLNTSSLVIGSVTNPGALKIGDTFYLLLNGSTSLTTGTFGNLGLGNTITDSYGDTYTVSYTANGDGGATGNDISLTVASLVPEPSAVAGCLCGAAGMIAAGFRRRAARHRGAPTAFDAVL